MENRTCGGCRWWDPASLSLVLRECVVPLPQWMWHEVLDERDWPGKHDDATHCPTWAEKENDDAG